MKTEMLNSDIKKYISNPVIGLLPFILYVILHAVLEETQYALGISLGFSIICDIILYYYFSSRIYNLVFYISTASLFLTLLFWIFAHTYITNPNIYLILCEFWVVIFFILLRVSKIYIVVRFYRKKNFTEKALVNAFFHSATMIQYMFTVHLLLILIDRQLRFGMIGYKVPDSIIFIVLPILIIFSLGFLQVVKIKSIIAALKKEEWLPIVIEKGEVTGKIAKSVSMRMKNKFLHPVVRIALISNGKIFLQEREDNDILNPGKLDYPFEKYMLFNHDINVSARNSIIRMLGENSNIPYKFLLKYVFENNETKRLVFLFIAEINDEDSIKRQGKINGKFWTIKQIEGAFADDIFSECFELEFEYIKNMVISPSDTPLFKTE